MTVTIDASVWVAARFHSEPGHVESVECLSVAIAARQTIVLPWLAWIECVAAVARKTESAALAVEAGTQLRASPAIRWVELDESAATEATAVASECRLRAADAVYASVARLHGATLVTLDDEMRAQCSGRVRCLPPHEWARHQDR